MDNGTLALLLSPVAVIITALITQWVVRRNAKESNEVDRFEAVLSGQDKRIETLEAEVLELKEKRTADRAEIARLRRIVRTWFAQLRIAWADHPTPMPMPPDDDLDFLGLTWPKTQATELIQKDSN